jgi:cytochrome b
MPHDDNHVPDSAAAVTRTAHVWDLPLRLFHWLLAASVTFAVVTAEIGGEWMSWHGRAGIFIAGLLGFRLAWGVVGSTTARFADFAPSPRSLRDYLRGRWRGLGHNPLGACSVLLLLGLLTAQVVTGLLGNDDIDFEGPWSAFIDKDLSDRITGWHHHLSNWLLAFLGLHIAAILYYLLVRKMNLILPMLSGRKKIDVEMQDTSTKDHASFSWPFLAAALVLAVLTSYVASSPGGLSQ